METMTIGEYIRRGSNRVDGRIRRVRVSVRSTVYHSQAGFLVSWTDPRRSWPQRMFTESRDIAERLEVAVQHDASFENLNAILCER